MVSKYVLQLLFSEKSQKMLKTQQPQKLEKKNTDLESVEFKKFFDACLTKFKSNYILLKKVATDFY
jgi:hypothetical protein